MISFSVKQVRNFYKRTRFYILLIGLIGFLGGGFFIGCLGFGNRFVHCFLSFVSNVRSLRFGGIFFSFVFMGVRDRFACFNTGRSV